MKKVVIFGLLVAISAAFGCEDDDDNCLSAQQQLEIDIELIQEYLAENNITATQHESGVFYIIRKEGTGVAPNSESTVKVNYKGNLLGETELFDSGDNITFPLYGVIQGWQIGIPLMTEGGAATFYIPSGWAYGCSGSGSIPGNAVLEFRVDLLDVL